ncbi:MAG: deoxyribodipyrimidine photo-lyase [Patescibacteria group bacterium]
MQTLKKRVLSYKETSPRAASGTVVYWMSRDQRVKDNWALFHAQQLALSYKIPLHVVFVQQKEFLQAQERIFEYMKNGLALAAQELFDLNITFEILDGLPHNELPNYLDKVKATALITDFSPLKIKSDWLKKLAPRVNCSIYVVDAHNIVPPWIASQKQEYAARTFRPKITSYLNEYLSELPKVVHHPFGQAKKSNLSTTNVSALHTDYLQDVEQTLSNYENRNNPLAHATSKLSRAIHFGHVSSLRLALFTQSLPQSTARDSFFEQLVVRRELAENYCYYNENYDNPEGFPLWAQQTLRVHSIDKRPYIYTTDQFEQATTHEPFWNAIQKELVKNGYLNGYLRMYWAKKILEWTPNPMVAQGIAIYLNDKYQFDGRDPNGYTGIAWAIGGVHDRPWFTREIFGTIRYMNESGARRKFDVDEYIKQI